MRYLTVAQAAKRVKRNVRTVERWIADDHLPVILDGHRRMVLESDLLRVWRGKMRSQWSPEAIADRLTHKYGRDAPS